MNKQKGKIRIIISTPEKRLHSPKRILNKSSTNKHISACQLSDPLKQRCQTTFVYTIASLVILQMNLKNLLVLMVVHGYQASWYLICLLLKMIMMKIKQKINEINKVHTTISGLLMIKKWNSTLWLLIKVM